MKHGGSTLALLHFGSALTDSIDVMRVNSCPLEDKTFQLERAVWVLGGSVRRRAKRIRGLALRGGLVFDRGKHLLNFWGLELL